MPIFGCGLILNGPTPKPHKFGLLTALDGGVQRMQEHQEGGFQVEDIYCSNLNSTLPDCDNGVPVVVPPKPADSGPTFCCIDPFTVYSSFDCSTGGTTIQRAYEIAQERYDANVERALENIFWTGITEAGPIEPSLATGNSSCGLTVVDLTPAGGAVSPLVGLAVLEQNIAGCWPGESIIHMPFGIIPLLGSSNHLRDEGDSLHTFSGNRIVAGQGYPTSGPGNTPAPVGEGWMFATSQIQGWRSAPFFNPPIEDQNASVDKLSNNITVRLEATWAFAFVCCIFAIRVRLSDCCC